MPNVYGPVTISAGELQLELVPEIGGSVASLRFAGTDLFRPLSDADRTARNVVGAGMFPMLPYANRIRDNCFEFGGKVWRFAPNNPPERLNVHGTGWHRVWNVKRRSATDVRLELEVNEPGDPYTYRASQHFACAPGGMTVELQLTNAGNEPMPFGFGLHPWFLRDPDVTLQFGARRFYLEEPENVAGDPVTLPPELDFAEARPLPTSWRNNDYGGWNGVATLRFPGRGIGLTIKADPIFGHLMIYADPGKPYFCVEPQSNASGAFNRSGGFDDPDEGAIVLEPGQTMAGKVHFEPFVLDRA